MPPRELERLYEEHAGALFAFVLNLTRSEMEVRDTLQELFTKLALSPELMREVRDERGFLIRLAHILVIDLMRRRASRSRAHDALGEERVDCFAPVSDPDESAFRHELSVALGELPADQRAVVHLKLWEGLTFERIADVLEIPLNTAASRYRYGLDKMRARLRPLYDEIR
jgi:RNA polymerase sigma-70 factor (ECF subfamily)